MKDLMAGHEIGFAEGKKKGREAGFAKGFAKGFAEGFIESFAEGELKKAREMAKGLRDDGVPMEIIVRRSGLSEEEIRKL